MIGVLFNLVVDWVRRKMGTMGVKELESRYGKELKFTDSVAYPDEDFLRLFVSAQEIMGINDLDLAQREFAKIVFKSLTSAFSGFVEKYPSTFSLLSHMEEIHNTVYLMKHKERVKIPMADENSNTVKIVYQSPTKLDPFFEQMILETARHFNEKVHIEYESKMTEGADKTVAIVKIEKK